MYSLLSTYVSLQSRSCELATYQYMAMLSDKFAFSHSKWNSTAKSHQFILSAAKCPDLGEPEEVSPSAHKCPLAEDSVLRRDLTDNYRGLLF